MGVLDRLLDLVDGLDDLANLPTDAILVPADPLGGIVDVPGGAVEVRDRFFEQCEWVNLAAGGVGESAVGARDGLGAKASRRGLVDRVRDSSRVSLDGVGAFVIRVAFGGRRGGGRRGRVDDEGDLLVVRELGDDRGGEAREGVVDRDADCVERFDFVCGHGVEVRVEHRGNAREDDVDVRELAAELAEGAVRVEVSAPV